MSQLKISLLGSPQIERDGALVETDTRKAVALAAYLAVTGQVHTRETLAAFLWPEYDQERAYANLRRTLWSLRQAVGEAWLAADQETIGLKRGPGFWLDVDQFRRHLAHLADDAAPDGIPALKAAVALYRDDFMAGFTLRDSPPFDEWQFFQAEGLRRELATALEELENCYVAAGEFELAIGCARRRLALDPLHEPAHRALIRLYAWAGQRAAALRQYRACARVLEEELGVEPEPETVRLYERVQTNQLAPPPGSAPEVSPPRTPERRHNLPPQLTPFIGRRAPLSEIGDLLRNPDCRLLTLVGPGGVGKTRLAVQAAREQVDGAAFPHGVYFVPLASVSSPEFIVPAIADVLGFSFFQREGEEPVQQLLNYLREKRMLLVLDNFEHIIGGAGLLVEVLRRAPEVVMLVTSRERLNLRGEWVLMVEGMRFPDPGTVDSLEREWKRAGEGEREEEGYSALQLFLQVARQVDVEFSLAEEEVSDVVRICRLVEGMPLAIEMAAAWVKALSCQEIAQEIEHSLDFLTTSMRDVPERHRSLRAVFEHSWRLLSESERAVFQRLTLFRGGFDREAAEQVAGASLAQLSSLVDQSLLRRDSSGRYGMHEVVRQYASAELARSADGGQAARDRHSAYFAAFLHQRERSIRGPQQRAILDQIGAEIENVRVAWHWATTECQVPEMKLAITNLFWFYGTRCLLQEGMEAMERAVVTLREQPQREKEADIVLGLALAFQGVFASRLYKPDEARSLLREGLAVLRSLEPGSELALVINLALPSDVVDNVAEAEALFRESLAIYQEMEDQGGIALALNTFSRIALIKDGHAEAKRYLEESLAISREIGDLWLMAYTLFDLGGILHHQEGMRQEAIRHYQESLDIRRALEDPWGTSICLDYIGYLFRELGEYEEARRLHRESMAVSQEIGDLLGIAGSLDNLGLVAYDLGEYEEAERLFREGLALRQAVDSPWDIVVSLGHLGQVALVWGRYDASACWYHQAAKVYEGLWEKFGIEDIFRGLGEIALARDEVTQAAQHLRAALEASRKHGTMARGMEILTCVARLWVRMGREERAAAVLAHISHHPASTQRVQDQAGALLDDLAQRLAPHALALAQEEGRAAPYDELADRVLAEVEGVGGTVPSA